MISLTEQYIPFDDVISRSAAYQEPLMTLWAEDLGAGRGLGRQLPALRKRLSVVREGRSQTDWPERVHAALVQFASSFGFRVFIAG